MKEIKTSTIAAAVLFGLLIVAIDFLYDYYMYYQRLIWQLSPTNRLSLELTSRLAFWVVLIIFGITIWGIILKRRQAIKALEQSERRYRALFEDTVVGIGVTSKEGRILASNKALQQTLGYSEAEMKQLSVNSTYHDPNDREQILSLLERDGVIRDYEVMLKHKDGASFYASLSISRQNLEGEDVFLSMIQDITKRKKAEEKTQRQYQFQVLLNNLLNISLKNYPFQEMLERTLLELHSTPWLGMKPNAAIFLIEEDPQVLVLKAQTGLAEITETCAQIPLGKCLCGQAAQSRKLVYASSVDECHVICYEGITPHGHYCLPIISLDDNKLLGVLDLYIKAGYRLDADEEKSVLPAIVNVLAGMIKSNRAAVALRESEEKYRAIFEQAADTILIATPDGALVDFNEQAYKNLGYTKEEFTGMKIADFEVLESPEKVVAHIEKIIKYGSDVFESKHRHKNGEERDVYVSVRRIIFNDRDYTLSICRDITELKKAEEALRRSEEQYRGIFEATADALMIADEKGVFVEVNPASCVMYGYSREELIGLHIKDIIPPAFRHQDSTGINLDKNLFMESVNVRKDCSLIDIELKISVFSFKGKPHQLAVIRDITDRKRAEKSLRESETKFRELSEQSPNMIFINKGGRVVYANKMCETIMGYTREEFLSPDFDFNVTTDPEYIGLVRESFQKHQQGIEIEPYEYGLVTKQGRKLKTIMSSKLIDYEGGKAILGIITDITAQKQAEMDLRAALTEIEKKNEELLALDKMKDGLLSDVTHELKTPVAKQRMQVELLKRHLRDKDFLIDNEKLITTMDAAIERQDTVISNILTLSRLEKGGREYHVEAMRLDTLLSEVLADYSFVIETHRMRLETILPAIEIESDLEMLFHVFSSLINNAIKFTETKSAPHLSVTLQKLPQKVLVQITDNGIGFSEPEKERAFERFYQASASTPGSGVGLTIAKRIVDGLGGKIWLESAGLDQGTTVLVELPDKFSQRH